MSAPSRRCAACGSPMAYAPQYGRWFCQTCQRFDPSPVAMHPAYYPQQPYQQPVQYAPHYPQQYQPHGQWQARPQAQPAPMGQGQMPPGYPQPNLQVTRQNLLRILEDGKSRRRDVSAGFAYGFLVAQTAFLAAVYVAAALLVIDGDSIDLNGLIAALLALLAFWALLGLAQAALVYRLVSMRDAHFRRDRLLREAVMQHLLALNAPTGKGGMDLAALAYLNASASTEEVWERGAMLWAVLAFIPVVNMITMPVLLYGLTRDYVAHDRRQAFICYHAGLAMARLGTPLKSPDWTRHPERSKGLYVLLAYMTGTLFLFYWYYATILDANSHAASQASFEDSLSAGLQG